MRIAIAVEGTRGDVYPMLALGRTLRAAGHRVRLCGPPDFEAETRAADLEFVSLGLGVRVFLDEAAEAIHRRGLRFLRELQRYGRLALEHQLRVLPEAVAGMDRLFAAGPVLGAATAAELHGIPFRFVAYTPAILPSREHTPALFPFQLDSPRHPALSRAANGALWWCFGRLTRWFAGAEIDRHRARLGLPPVGDLLAHAMSPRPIVAVDRALAAMPEDGGFPFDQIRCLHPLSGEPLPEKLEHFLEQGPPPVYLGFGSMPDPHPVRTTRLLLEALSRLGCRALISRGWAGLGDGPLPEGVMVLDPVSHASLFPRMAAVVHHGGAGTTHSAARAGVPQIVVPHLLDQFYFAQRVVALGVGPPPIARRRLRVDRLVEVLEASLGNEILAERARELAARLRDLGPTEPDLERLLAAGESRRAAAAR